MQLVDNSFILTAIFHWNDEWKKCLKYISVFLPNSKIFSIILILCFCLVNLFLFIYIVDKITCIASCFKREQSGTFFKGPRIYIIHIYKINLHIICGISFAIDNLYKAGEEQTRALLFITLPAFSPLKFLFLFLLHILCHTFIKHF